MPDAHLPRTTVSAADISRNFGEWQSRAMAAPVAITHHGRVRLVLASLEDYYARGAAEPAPSITTPTTNFQLSALIGQMLGGFIAYDTNLKITAANAHAELFLGLSLSDMLGRDLRDLRPETANSVTWSYINRVLKTGESVSCTIVSTLQDHPVQELRVFPYADGAGIIFQSARAEHLLARCESQARALASAIQLERQFAVVALNIRGGITHADPAFCDMTGFSRTQLVSLLMTQVAPPRERGALAQAINRALTEGTARPHDGAIMTRSGDERRLRFNMGPTDTDGVVDGLIVLVVDHDGQDPVWPGP